MYICPLYLVGDACTDFRLSFLFYVSLLASCSDHFIFEKLMFTFIDLIHALPTRGESCASNSNCICGDGYSIQGGDLEFAHICLGGLAFMHGELFVLPKVALCFALLLMVSSPFASPRGVGVVSVLSRLC
jgi:hypothetical protein